MWWRKTKRQQQRRKQIDINEKKNQRQLSLTHSLTLSLARSLTHSLTQALWLHSSGQLFVPTPKAIRYSTNTYLICDIWYVTLRLRDRRGAASLRYRIRAEFTVPMCEQKPRMVSRRRNSYPVQCDWNSLKKTVLDGRQYSWPEWSVIEPLYLFFSLIF